MNESEFPNRSTVGNPAESQYSGNRAWDDAPPGAPQSENRASQRYSCIDSVSEFSRKEVKACRVKEQVFGTVLRAFEACEVRCLTLRLRLRFDPLVQVLMMSVFRCAT